MLKWIIQMSVETLSPLKNHHQSMKGEKSPVKNEYACLHNAMFNSLRTEKYRIAFSKGDLKHPSKAAL